MKTSAILPCVVSLLFAFPAMAQHWPQWRGPNADGKSTDTGLLTSWPEAGPKKVWEFHNAGIGYGGFSIADGTLYVLGFRENKEVLIAIDVENGREKWASAFGRFFENKWGDGPRGTPTIQGEHVYIIGAQGDIACLKRADGSEVWKRTMADFGGEVPNWGYTESPLIEGPWLLCTPGGKKGAVVALNRTDGSLVWQSSELTDPAQYSSLVVADIKGKRQVVQLFMLSVAGVNLADGKLLWRNEWPGRTAVIPTPIVHDNHVYITAGYGIGCRLISIGADQSPTVVYDNKVMKNHHGGVILHEGYLYGHSDKTGWVCQNWKTGEETWSEKELLGKGAIGYADGHFYCLDEKDGTLALIEATPTGYKEKSRFVLSPQTRLRKPDGRIWTHPVISGGKLFLRDQEIIICYSVAQ